MECTAAWCLVTDGPVVNIWIYRSSRLAVGRGTADAQDSTIYYRELRFVTYSSICLLAMPDLGIDTLERMQILVRFELCFTIWFLLIGWYYLRLVNRVVSALMIIFYARKVESIMLI